MRLFRPVRTGPPERRTGLRGAGSPFRLQAFGVGRGRFGRRTGLCMTLLAMGIAGMLGLFGGVPGAGAADPEPSPLTLLVFERHPYYSRADEGGFDGLVASRVVQALERAGIAYTWQLMQPNGHLRTVAADAGPVCAVGWFRSPPREEIGLFSDPVRRDGPTVVVIRSDNARLLEHRTFSEIIEDPALRLGTRLGYSYGAALDDRIAAAQPPRVTASQDEQGLMRMLLGSRFDYMLMGRDEAEDMIHAFGQAGQDLIALELPDLPEGNTRHLLCSRSVGATTVERINAALAALPSEQP